MDPHSFIARAEAQRWIGIAEKLLMSHDLVGSKTFAIRARESDPRLEAADQILAITETLTAAEKPVVGNDGSQQPDYYAILQLVRFVSDAEHIAGQYRRLAILLNPNQNRFPYSEQAFQVVNDAWAVLSNPMRKSVYDSELNYLPHQQQQVGNLGFNIDQQHQHQQTHQQQHNFFEQNQQQQQQQQQHLQQHNFLGQQGQLFQQNKQQAQARLQSPPPSAAAQNASYSWPPQSQAQSHHQMQEDLKPQVHLHQHLKSPPHHMKQEHMQHQVPLQQQLQQKQKEQQLQLEQQKKRQQEEEQRRLQEQQLKFHQEEERRRLQEQQKLQQEPEQRRLQEQQRRLKEQEEEQRRQQELQQRCLKEQEQEQRRQQEHQRRLKEQEEEQRRVQELQLRHLKEQEEEQRRQQEQQWRLKEQEEEQRRVQELQQRRLKELEEEQRRQQEHQRRLKEQEEEQRRVQELQQRRLQEHEEEQHRLKEKEEEQQRLQEQEEKKIRQQQEALRQNATPVQLPCQDNANNGVTQEEMETEPEPVAEEETDTADESMDDSPTFWTACPYCFYMYEYPKRYVECTLRCDNCRRAFQAVPVPSPPPTIEGQDAYFYCWGFFPVGVSMSDLQKNNSSKGTKSKWTPFSPLYDASQNHLNECAAPKENTFVNKSSGPRVSFHDVLNEVSELSDDSDIEWNKTQKKKLKRMSSDMISDFKARVQVLALRAKDTINANDKNKKNNTQGRVGVSTVPMAETSNKFVGSISREQSGGVAKESGKLDLNVEFDNHVAAGTRGHEDGEEEEDNIEGIGFFEGLDEFLNNLPILSANEEKVKAT